jgi:hypothetical protein
VILKEADKKEAINKFEKYGLKAEKQMAHYLKRAFQDKKDIFVINDLRLEMNDDIAQIDHLIIHRYGFLIIESKSVTSKISINEYGEWVRHYLKNTNGMPSPINQARRQADFLKNYLMARSENLLKKSLIFQASFTDFKFDILVAISDSGIINRPKNSDISEVYKADQITDEINSLISSYAGTNKNILTLKVNYHFADTSMDKITRYLTQTHKPVKRVNKLEVKETKAVYFTSPEKKKETKELVHHSCSKCNSDNVEIVYGKFGYYFKCHDCNGNTSIKLKCKEASCKPKLRKQKLTFYKECTVCKSSEVFFTNKESQKV